MANKTIQQNAPPAIDPKTEAFVGKVLGDTSAFTTVVLASLGDRLGLFKDMAASGPQTTVEIAEHTKTSERYVREWAGAMNAAGYIAYDPATRRYALPAENVPVLAQELGPVFFGGVQSMAVDGMKVFDQIVEAFRTGGGVPQAAYPAGFYDNMDRFTSGWHENLLLQQWIPAIEGLSARLAQGIRVADVGCGRGRALINLAKAFPKSRFVGYDVYAPNIDRARAHAREAGVADRVTFKVRDVSQGLPAKFDLVTTFDVVHDAADPQGLLRTIRQGLSPGGTYVNLDINCSDKVEGNTGPLGAFFYGVSVMYCMTTSLANGGAGLGTVGLHEPKLQELAKQVGFRSVRKLPLENPFNNLYALTV